MRFSVVLTLLIFFLTGAEISAQATIPLFNSEELLQLELKFDISEYRRKKSDTDYLDATISYKDNGKTITDSIKLRSRGIFRRSFCELPPIMLNFKKKNTGSGLFRNINKLKMVTECPQGNKDYLLREYLAYKLYNVLTDQSFKVRLAKVKYVNTAKNGKSFEQYAFFIEPEELLAKRMHSEPVMENMTQKMVRPDVMDRMAIFNYMIGNTDWSVPISHNIQLFDEDLNLKSNPLLIVPYDFDFAGLVNAYYAEPFTGLQITNVRQRLYLGICRDKATYLSDLTEFTSRKEALLKVVSEFPYLAERSKKDMEIYLLSFFKDLEKPESLTKNFLIDCIKF